MGDREVFAGWTIRQLQVSRRVGDGSGAGNNAYPLRSDEHESNAARTSLPCRNTFKKMEAMRGRQ